MRPSSAVDLEQFAAVGAALYGSVDHPGAPTAARTRALLAAANPTRARCEVELFANARARVAAIANPRLRDDGGQPLGLLGLFEAADDPDAAGAVIDAAAAWLRARGCAALRGPVDFSTWHNYRFTTRVHAAGWFPGEPFHHDYYPALWQRLGFHAVAGYASSWTGDPVAVGEEFRHKGRPAVEAGYTIRTIATDGSDLDALYQLASAGFERAFMFSPIDRDEFSMLYGAQQAAAIGPTSYLVHGPSGEPAGFLAGYRVPYGDRGLVGILKSVAIAPAHRGTGVYHMLFGTFIRDAHAAGCAEVIAALMYMDGDPAKMGWHHRGTLTKEYSLYERAL